MDVEEKKHVHLYTARTISDLLQALSNTTPMEQEGSTGRADQAGTDFSWRGIKGCLCSRSYADPDGDKGCHRRTAPQTRNGGIGWEVLLWRVSAAGLFSSFLRQRTEVLNKQLLESLLPSVRRR